MVQIYSQFVPDLTRTFSYFPYLGLGQNASGCIRTSLLHSGCSHFSLLFSSCPHSLSQTTLALLAIFHTWVWDKTPSRKSTITFDNIGSLLRYCISFLLLNFIKLYYIII